MRVIPNRSIVAILRFVLRRVTEFGFIRFEERIRIAILFEIYRTTLLIRVVRDFGFDSKLLKEREFHGIPRMPGICIIFKSFGARQ